MAEDVKATAVKATAAAKRTESPKGIYSQEYYEKIKVRTGTDGDKIKTDFDGKVINK